MKNLLYYSKEIFISFTLYPNNMLFNYPSLSVKNKRSQSALEYMMTYGWAILIIVIVAVILYSMGIFNPSSSISATVTGFSGLGSVTAQCTANGVLRISVGDSTGNLINITGITAKDPAITKISNFKPNSTVDPNPLIRSGSSYIFSVPNICPSAGTHYAITVAVNYTEPGQPLPGPYQSLGSITGTSTSTVLPAFVASFAAPYNISATPSNDNSYMYYTLPTSTGLANVVNFTFTITGWVKMPKENGPGNTGQWMADALFYFGPSGIGRYAAFIFTPPPLQEVIHTCYNDIHSNSFSVNVFNNSWYFFAASINSTYGLFQLGQTQSVVSDYSNYRASNGYVVVGASFYCSDFGLIGDLADLQLYNSSLSSQELMSIYKEGITGGPITSNGLVAFWPLNGTLKDYSGHGFDLVDNGAFFTSNYK